MIILGNTVVIRDKTYDYIFMHLHSVDVEINQEVVEGQHIGGVGTTGIYSTGNHLHFAITKGSYTTKKLCKSFGYNCNSKLIYIIHLQLKW